MTGELIVFDALSLTVKNVFVAHKAPIAALALSPSGNLLASASDKVCGRSVVVVVCRGGVTMTHARVPLD